MSISENIQSVRDRISEAAIKSGRGPEEITLVAVTKNQPVSAIKEVISMGIVDLGENRSQELLDKRQAIGERVNWHFIGHLQRNKVKYVIPFVYLIQSVDNIGLAREIDKRAGEMGKVQDVLLEVNTSGEITKYGFSPGELFSAVDQMAQLDNILIKGLMTMAPFTDDIGVLKSHFAKSKELFDNLSREQGANLEMRYLSMGMTNDFEVAIEEGSNMVRVGTALFQP